MTSLSGLSMTYSVLNVTCSFEQNPNVAFDFDHWEECEEDSQLPQGKMGCAHLLGSYRC